MFGLVHVRSVALLVQAQVEALQHTPVHGEGEQTLVRPLYVVPEAQPVAVTEVQAQLEVSQHTPGHTAAQVPPQVNAFGEVQLAGTVTEQMPVALLQHLPVHGTGEQDPPQ